jgi:hypothetical protein
MTAEERAALARRLLALTREMVEFARGKDWVALAQAEIERQELSRQLFASPVPPEAAPTVAECVRQVLSLDQELIVLAEAGREAAARSLQEARTGQRAAAAYRRFSR